MNKHRVLCGTDFSLYAAAAGTVAARLAARWEESLLLIHVQDSHTQPNSAGRLEAEAERLRQLGATVKTELKEGSPYEQLIECAASPSTRLIVLSSLGRIAPSRFLVGSVAERTAEHAPAPTLIVRNEKPFSSWSSEQPLKILLCHDFSASADAALRWGHDLAKLGPCEITVAHVAWPVRSRGEPSTGEVLPALQVTPEEHARLHKDLESRVSSHLPGQKAQIRLLQSWGCPDASLLQLASEIQAGLVIVGTHQRHGLEKVWLGSVSRSVLRNALTNVAIVPAPRHQDWRAARA